jgi:hypothetical protein
MYELFIFQTLVDREAPDIEHEPVTMIQHDQQSRWKAWMRLLAVDIRPVSMSMLRKSTSLSLGVRTEGPFLPRCDRRSGAPICDWLLLGPHVGLDNENTD